MSNPPHPCGSAGSAAGGPGRGAPGKDRGGGEGSSNNRGGGVAKRRKRGRKVRGGGRGWGGQTQSGTNLLDWSNVTINVFNNSMTVVHGSTQYGYPQLPPPNRQQYVLQHDHHHQQMLQHHQQMRQNREQMQLHREQMQLHREQMQMHHQHMYMHQQHMRQHDLQMQQHNEQMRQHNEQMRQHNQQMRQHNQQMRQHNQQMLQQWQPSFQLQQGGVLLQIEPQAQRLALMPPSAGTVDGASVHTRPIVAGGFVEEESAVPPKFEPSHVHNMAAKAYKARVRKGIEGPAQLQKETEERITKVEKENCMLSGQSQQSSVGGDGGVPALPPVIKCKEENDDA